METAASALILAERFLQTRAGAGEGARAPSGVLMSDAGAWRWLGLLCCKKSHGDATARNMSHSSDRGVPNAGCAPMRRPGSSKTHRLISKSANLRGSCSPRPKRMGLSVDDRVRSVSTIGT